MKSSSVLKIKRIPATQQYQVFHGQRKVYSTMDPLDAVDELVERYQISVQKGRELTVSKAPLTVTLLKKYSRILKKSDSPMINSPMGIQLLKDLKFLTSK